MESPFFRSYTAQLFLRAYFLFLLYLKLYPDTIDFKILFHPKKPQLVSKTVLMQYMVLNQTKRVM